MSKQPTSFREGRQVGCCVGNLAGSYTDEHSAQNHPHILAEALTAKAAESLRPSLGDCSDGLEPVVFPVSGFPEVRYTGELSIKDRIERIKKLDFSKPMDIDFDKLFDDKILFVIDDTLTIFEDDLFVDDGQTIVCKLSESEWSEGFRLEKQLKDAYAEAFVFYQEGRPRAILEGRLSRLRDELLLETDDRRLANLRAQIRECLYRLNGRLY